MLPAVTQCNALTAPTKSLRNYLRSPRKREPVSRIKSAFCNHLNFVSGMLCSRRRATCTRHLISEGRFRPNRLPVGRHPSRSVLTIRAKSVGRPFELEQRRLRLISGGVNYRYKRPDAAYTCLYPHDLISAERRPYAHTHAYTHAYIGPIIIEIASRFT
jgi:hypothetical protein